MNWEQKYDALASMIEGYRHERNEAQARVIDAALIHAELVRERDEARAEVERLRAEAERWERSCNVFRERDWPKAFQATVTSLEQEVSDAHEQLAKLRKLSKPWEGDAYRRGAEAMRAKCEQIARHACSFIGNMESTYGVMTQGHVETVSRLILEADISEEP